MRRIRRSKLKKVGRYSEDISWAELVVYAPYILALSIKDLNDQRLVVVSVWTLHVITQVSAYSVIDGA